jgi:hypothetical protein
MVFSPCNSSYSEAKIGNITVQSQPRKKLIETPFQPTSQPWWCTPVIPRYVEDVGMRITVQGQSQTKNTRHYQKNN